MIEPSPAETCPLDSAVMQAVSDLESRAFPKPEVLLFLGTGVGMMPAHLRAGARLPIGRITGAPPAWSQVLLYSGLLGETAVWLLEDAPGAPEEGTHQPLDEPPWVRGYPCWLAAAAGASVCVHTSAGHALADANGRLIRPGSLAMLRDHINFSGRTPLVGLGASKLGPLFPDASRLHHADLRRAALRHGASLGVPVGEAVAACTPGPALETAAERVWWARAGADVAVQNLATPLLSCAHAGLSVLALVAVTDAGDGLQDMGGLVAQAEKLAPAIEDLLVDLAADLARTASDLGVDE